MLPPVCLTQFMAAAALSTTFALVGALTCAFPSHQDKGYKKHVTLSLLQDLYLKV